MILIACDVGNLACFYYYSAIIGVFSVLYVGLFFRLRDIEDNISLWWDYRKQKRGKLKGSTIRVEVSTFRAVVVISSLIFLFSIFPVVISFSIYKMTGASIGYIILIFLCLFILPLLMTLVSRLNIYKTKK